MLESVQKTLTYIKTSPTSEEEISKEYQQQAISLLMQQPELMDEAKRRFKPYFFTGTERKVFSYMVENKNCTFAELREKGVGSLYELCSIESAVCPAFVCKQRILSIFDGVVYSFKAYAKKKILSEMTASNTAEIMARLKRLEELDGETEADDSFEELLKSIDRRVRGEKDPAILPTGFSGIDYFIEGFKQSELFILGGRAGSGKTSMSLNMALNIAKRGEGKPLYYSLEMSKKELLERMTIIESGVTVNKETSTQDFERFMNTARKVKDMLIINDKAGITIDELMSNASFEVSGGGVSCIFIDNLAILKSSKAYKSRYEEVSDLSRLLKVMAKNLNIPVICLAQLNRAVESRQSPIPTLADIRDSGSVEQDADIIGFVYRPEYHLAQKEPDTKNSPEWLKWKASMDECKGKAQFIIAKNRRGNTGQAKMMFRGDLYKFYDRGE